MKGFTLFEIILYIALFTIIMAGGFITSFALLDSAQANKEKAVTNQEGEFVLRKIEWALGSIESVNKPSDTIPTSDTLALDRISSPNSVSIRYNSTDKDIEVSQNGGTTYLPITTANVSVTGLQFDYIAPTGGSPAGISASTTIDGVNFTTIRYIRK